MTVIIRILQGNFKNNVAIIQLKTIWFKSIFTPFGNKRLQQGSTHNFSSMHTKYPTNIRLSVGVMNCSVWSGNFHICLKLQRLYMQPCAAIFSIFMFLYATFHMLQTTQRVVYFRVNVSYETSFFKHMKLMNYLFDE